MLSGALVKAARKLELEVVVKYFGVGGGYDGSNGGGWIGHGSPSVAAVSVIDPWSTTYLTLRSFRFGQCSIASVGNPYMRDKSNVRIDGERRSLRIEDVMDGST